MWAPICAAGKSDSRTAFMLFVSMSVPLFVCVFLCLIVTGSIRSSFTANLPSGGCGAFVLSRDARRIKGFPWTDEAEINFVQILIGTYRLRDVQGFEGDKDKSWGMLVCSP